MAGAAGRVRSWFGDRHWAAWVISGVGLALAGLSLWYLIVVQALYLGTAAGDGAFELLLQAMEVVLLAGFSVVLIYGGYWLAASPFDRQRVWWAGLWTVLGMAGIVAIVAFVTAFRVSQGRSVSRPTLVQEMLLAAGGGALAGLLIGISTVRETMQSEQARTQRNTLLFVNQLLRHNVLNGMNVILGNTDLLREHVDEAGERYLEANEDRARAIVDLVEDVQSLMQSVSGETSLAPVALEPVLEREVRTARESYPAATVDLDVPSDVRVVADELLNSVFENLLDNAIEHNDRAEPRVEVTVEEREETVRVHVADDGPGIPDERKDLYFDPGEQDEDSVGQGLGLYLVDTLVDRYGGDVTIADNEPRGTVVTVELERPE